MSARPVKSETAASAAHALIDGVGAANGAFDGVAGVVQEEHDRRTVRQRHGCQILDGQLGVYKVWGPRRTIRLSFLPREAGMSGAPQPMRDGVQQRGDVARLEEDLDESERVVVECLRHRIAKLAFGLDAPGGH